MFSLVADGWVRRIIQCALSPLNPRDETWDGSGEARGKGGESLRYREAKRVHEYMKGERDRKRVI